MKAYRFSLLLVLAGVAAFAPAPAARSDTVVSPGRVIRDCAEHGRLTQRYALAELRRVKRHLPVDVAKYTFCRGAVRSAIAAQAGRPGTRSHAAVVRDCVAHRGAVTHRYPLALLRSVRRTLPYDVARYTDCADGIATQIHQLR